MNTKALLLYQSYQWTELFNRIVENVPLAPPDFGLGVDELPLRSAQCAATRQRIWERARRSKSESTSDELIGMKLRGRVVATAGDEDFVGARTGNEIGNG
jgi:hypothetical protein